MVSTTEAVKTSDIPVAISAYAALEAGQPLMPYQYVPQTLRALDVEIKITHCGMCHTDLHLVNNDFGISAYPLVPGHEIVGTVSQRGASVTDLRVGERVGIGWLAGADFTCEQCQSGQDNLCLNGQPTCLGREGGYAQYIRVDSRLTSPYPMRYHPNMRLRSCALASRCLPPCFGIMSRRLPGWVLSGLVVWGIWRCSMAGRWAVR